MAARWTILLLGSLLVAAAGGAISAAPLLRAALHAEASREEGPTPELEAARLAVFGDMDRTVAGLVQRASELELLSDLLADAAHERDRPAVGTVSYGAPAADPASAR